MKKNIVIIILSILVIGLGGYLVYDKVLDKDDLEDVQQNEDNQENKIRAVYNKDSKWYNYLKNVDITSVKLSFWKLDSNSEMGRSNKDIELSKEEINELLEEMARGILTNNNVIGYAVPSNFDFLKIEYGDGKWIWFYDFSYIETNDEVLKEYLVQDVGTSVFLYRFYWANRYAYEKYNK